MKLPPVRLTMHEVEVRVSQSAELLERVRDPRVHGLGATRRDIAAAFRPLRFVSQQQINLTVAHVRYRMALAGVLAEVLEAVRSSRRGLHRGGLAQGGDMAG